jgi:hypothetical protein
MGFDERLTAPSRDPVSGCCSLQHQVPRDHFYGCTFRVVRSVRLCGWPRRISSVPSVVTDVELAKLGFWRI